MSSRPPWRWRLFEFCKGRKRLTLTRWAFAIMRTTRTDAPLRNRSRHLPVSKRMARQMNIPLQHSLVYVRTFPAHCSLPTPSLTLSGFDYSGDVRGSFYTKIHPGTYFVVLSFLILLGSRGDPIGEALHLLRQVRAFMFLLLIDVLLTILWIARDPSGVGMMLDTTFRFPSVRLSVHSPARYSRKAAHFFIALATLNSIVGIAESVGRFRIFAFRPDWGVLNEEYFLLPFWHPLNNAMFTAVANSILLGLPLRHMVKTSLLAILLTSLVAFGGRAALGSSVLGLLADLALSGYSDHL